MDLAKQLAAELTHLRSKASKVESIETFTNEYSRLLALLTATMQTMKALAVEQGRFLQGEAGRQGRMN